MQEAGGIVGGSGECVVQDTASEQSKFQYFKMPWLGVGRAVSRAVWVPAAAGLEHVALWALRNATSCVHSGATEYATLSLALWFRLCFYLPARPTRRCDERVSLTMAAVAVSEPFLSRRTSLPGGLQPALRHNVLV